jgi:hypothetical protein
VLSSLVEIITTFPSRVSNFLTVITSELNPLPIESLIVGLLWFAFFYFPSKWFKAYLLRAFLFIVGVAIFYDVMGRDRIIFSIDFYGSIGLFLPHVEIVEITYLIIRERTLYLYDQIKAFILWILSPFIWLYNLFSKLFSFFQSKKEQRAYKKQQQREAQEEFKRQQQYHYEQEQQKYDEQDRQQANHNQKRFEDKRKQKKQQQQQQTKQEKPKEESRWDSSNPYIVLGISENATKQEIKKAYRTLSKIYHPDLVMFEKEKQKNTEIIQKINNAYDKLK